MAFVGLALAPGCGPGEDGPLDPLDPELIVDLAAAQGSASGSARSGTWTFSFVLESCDCPTLSVGGEAQDICEFAELDDTQLELVEGSGRLALPLDSEGQLGVLTGAVDQDGAFIVASRHDLGTLVGPLESLVRFDGQFDAAADSARGWAGHRLRGSVAGDDIDCRALGRFVATRP